MKTLIVLNQSDVIAPMAPYDFVIGVDGGCYWCLEKNIAIDLAIGDFDSLSTEQLDQLIAQGIRVESYPTEKDFTDLELAITAALKVNPIEITVLGVWGGRTDHSLANLFCLARQTAQIPVIMPGTSQTGVLLKNNQKICITTSEQSLLSIFAMFADCKGVSNQGMKYPLKNVTLKHGSGHGISNVTLENNCEVGLRQGIMLVLTENTVDTKITSYLD